MRVFSEPPQPCAPREIALENRPCIDVGLSRNPAADLELQPAVELVQPISHDGVVVVTAGVARHRTTRPPTAVIESDDYRPGRAAKSQARVATLSRPARQVIHFAGVALF